MWHALPDYALDGDHYCLPRPEPIDLPQVEHRWNALYEWVVWVLYFKIGE